MSIDHTHVDAALTTTRAVRRRLDLDRPVDDELLLECIDIAEQAPTGGNLGSRRWIIVRDPVVKAELGDFYRLMAAPWMSSVAERLRGSGHPSELVMASSAYLAEHLGEAPAIVIPSILGRHDNSGRPSLFDSVIQAAWSFCLALRARGLGTTWVTAPLQNEQRIKEIVGAPGDTTEIALFPVAYTIGADFKRAPRRPARTITYFDRYGTIVDSGPSDGVRFRDGPGTIVEIDIDAAPSIVWALASDINTPAEYSTEFVGAEWDGDERGMGALFHGRNERSGVGEWTVPCYVDAYEPDRKFGWRTSDRDNPGARWAFELEPKEAGTRLRFAYSMGPGWSGTSMAIEQNPEKEQTIVRRRIEAVRANMLRTIEGIKARAESA